MVVTKLNQYLKMFRKRSGLSQEELAELLKCSTGDLIGSYERGQSLPNFDNLLGFEVFFQTWTKELFAGRYDRKAEGMRSTARKMLRRFSGEEPTVQLKKKIDVLKEFISGEVNGQGTQISE